MLKLDSLRTHLVELTEIESVRLELQSNALPTELQFLIAGQVNYDITTLSLTNFCSSFELQSLIIKSGEIRLRFETLCLQSICAPSNTLSPWRLSCSYPGSFRYGRLNQITKCEKIEISVNPFGPWWELNPRSIYLN